MQQLPDLPVSMCVGGPLSAMTVRPLPPFSPLVLAFLGELSRRLLAGPAAHHHPDVAAFAYWCRPANLSRLARSYQDGVCRLGRGLAFHIAPANVPVNFAFSLAFGMLAGNANIVRIPEADHPQVETLCTAMQALFTDPGHARVAAMNRLVRYPRNDDITGAFSALCHARILWGGDQTIRHLRQLPLHPRAVEVTFADRYSLCLIDAAAVLAATDQELGQLAHGFCNDVFVLDQNACSSPHLVIWQGEAGRVEAAMTRFWPAVAALAAARFPVPAVQAVDKLVHLARTAITLPEAAGCTRHGNGIYRVRLQTLPAQIERHRGRHGFFLEYATENWDCLEAIVDERYQTLTCFGINRAALADFVAARGLTGLDRIVAIGEALDIGVIWDGYDLIRTLSRTIAIV